MKFVPHDYQKYAIDYIESHPVAAVLLDMGLGKTVSTLTALNDLMYDRFEIHKVLVIAPLRVALNTWPDEVQKWDHLKHLRMSVAVGNAKTRMKALKTPADIYVINRENLEWLVEESGMPFDYDAIVIDELSSFKNHKSKRFRSLIRVRPLVQRIIGLTGTPAGNGLMDLWAEFRVLDMGKRLGRFITRYREQYFLPDKTNGMAVYSYKLRPGAEKQIYKAIEDITISMKCCDHLDMPEKVMLVTPAVMNSDEMETYDILKKDLVMQLPEGKVTAANAAALCGKLCQMANGAVYKDDGKVQVFHDRKLEVLQDLIEAANGSPVLIAYTFRHDLARIQKLCGAKEIRTTKDIDLWNAGKIPVGIIHPASAGHGLNLQKGGSVLIWFGLPWSLELYQQTNARLWRQGQKDSVTVYHIVTKYTIDDKILKVLQGKDKRQESLIEAVKAEVRR